MKLSLSRIHALFMSAPFEFGFSYKKWEHSVHCMLMKSGHSLHSSNHPTLRRTLQWAAINGIWRYDKAKFRSYERVAIKQ